MTERRGDPAVLPKHGLDASAVYLLGRSEGETARLQRQADELTPDSRAPLDRASLRPGQSVIDLGCGPRGFSTC
jgi:cyclopropane fatty-acyl-phospholipid synthase-like methyltransferase